MTEIAELVNISTDCKFLMFYFCTLNVRKWYFDKKSAQI
jgi:hypothetical protein